MAESRCGILCSECARRENVRCAGCAAMKMPFWGGECGVKSCAEKKGIEHCGECAEFPCAMCANMGKENGYDPEPRLNRCRAWRNNPSDN